jgi:hypothetical protein
VGIVSSIEETLGEHTKMLKKLIASNKPDSSPACLPEGAKYPIENLTDFVASERQLADDDFLNGVVS